MSDEPTFGVRLDTTALELAREACEALQHAELAEALEELHDRLLSTGRGRQAWTVEGVETTGRTSAEVRLVWHPFAELVLRDVTFIARSTGSQPSKTSAVRGVLSLAGY